MEFQILSNGIEIPALGLGTWFIDDDKADKAVISAVKIGYRHIDTAQAYGNERGVGAGIKACGIPLDKMGLPYIDLMLIHSPQPWAEWRDDKRYFEENVQVWKALEDAYTAGKVKAIGVSNFLIDDLENLLSHCKIRPMVNQLLIHIGNTPAELIAYCKEQNIVVEAYSPIAHGKALKNETIVAMAQKYGVSVPQLCVKYVLNLGTVALPKTANAEHMQNNANLDFEISNEDMETLKSLNFKNYGEYSFFPVFSGK